MVLLHEDCQKFREPSGEEASCETVLVGQAGNCKQTLEGCQSDDEYL